MLNESCSRIQYDKNLYSDTVSNLKKTKSEQEYYNKLLNEIEQKNHIEKRINDLNTFIEANSDYYNFIQNLKSDYDTINSELKILVSETEGIDGGKQKSMLKDLQQKSKEIDNEYTEARIKLNDMITKANRKIELMKKIKRIQSDLIQINKDLSNYNILIHMFSKDGIPSLEIENELHLIENNANFILQELDLNQRVSINSTRMANKKIKDEINISIYDQEKVTGFHMESGGSKTNVSLAIRLAISKYIQDKRGIDHGILFLDEPDSALDSTNRENLTKLVTNTIIKKMGYHQIFWISHNHNIKESISHILKIIRRPDDSIGRWA